MSSLTKRSGMWYAVYSVDGQRVRRATGVPVAGEKGGMSARERKRLAEMTAQAMEAAARGEATVAAAMQAVQVAAGKWAGKAGLEAGRRPKTVGALWDEAVADAPLKLSGGGRDLVRLVAAAWQKALPETWDAPLGEVTTAHCSLLVERLHVELSEGTTRKYVECARRVFAAAVEAGVIERSPLAALRLGAVKRQRREAFSADEVRRMVRDFPGEWPDMIMCCILLGGAAAGGYCRAALGYGALVGGVYPFVHEQDAAEYV